MIQTFFSIMLMINLWVLEISDFKNYIRSHHIILNLIELDHALCRIFFDQKPEHIAWIIPEKDHFPVQHLVVVQPSQSIHVPNLLLIDFFKVNLKVEQL